MEQGHADSSCWYQSNLAMYRPPKKINILKLCILIILFVFLPSLHDSLFYSDSDDSARDEPQSATKLSKDRLGSRYGYSPYRKLYQHVDKGAERPEILRTHHGDKNSGHTFDVDDISPEAKQADGKIEEDLQKNTRDNKDISSHYDLENVENYESSAEVLGYGKGNEDLPENASISDRASSNDENKLRWTDVSTVGDDTGEDPFNEEAVNNISASNESSFDTNPVKENISETNISVDKNNVNTEKSRQETDSQEKGTIKQSLENESIPKESPLLWQLQQHKLSLLKPEQQQQPTKINGSQVSTEPRGQQKQQQHEILQRNLGFIANKAAQEENSTDLAQLQNNRSPSVKEQPLHFENEIQDQDTTHLQSSGIGQVQSQQQHKQVNTQKHVIELPAQLQKTTQEPTELVQYPSLANSGKQEANTMQQQANNMQQQANNMQQQSLDQLAQVQQQGQEQSILFQKPNQEQPSQIQQQKQYFSSEFQQQAPELPSQVQTKNTELTSQEQQLNTKLESPVQQEHRELESQVQQNTLGKQTAQDEVLQGKLNQLTSNVQQQDGDQQNSTLDQKNTEQQKHTHQQNETQSQHIRKLVHVKKEHTIPADYAKKISYLASDPKPKGSPVKILAWSRDQVIRQVILATGTSSFRLENGLECQLSRNRSDYDDAEAIIFKLSSEKGFRSFPRYRYSNQKWVLYDNEPPPRCDIRWPPRPDIDYLRHMFNITSFFVPDSSVPYRWPYYQKPYKGLNGRKYKYYQSLNLDFASKKTRNVAWFVSHCDTQSQREVFAKELQKYIDVDIYGNCGNLTCGNSHERGDCDITVLNKTYRFYLAFENSLCEGYITEKLWRILGYPIASIPIAMGYEDYYRFLPLRTVIDVRQYDNMKQLAKRLYTIAEDPALFNDYIMRKLSLKHLPDTEYTTPYIYRLCEHLHKQRNQKEVVDDVKEFWSTEKRCVEPWDYIPGNFWNRPL